MRIIKVNGWRLSVAGLMLMISSAVFADKAFVFDPKEHTWYAYDNGQLVNSGAASGGSGYCKDLHKPCRTPAGVYSVYFMGSEACKSTKFPLPNGGAPMPYCMFFHEGFAIHASNNVPDSNVSHGCIRVEPQAARWLSENFVDVGTKVVVKSY